MRLDDERESSNIENQRGSGGFGGGGSPFGLGGGRGGGVGLFGLLVPLIMSRFGIGGLVVVGVIYLVFGGGLGGLLGGVGGGLAPREAGFQPAAQPAGPAGNATDRFVSQVLASTEDTWSRIFQASGQDYPEPTLVFYSGAGQSGCGVAQSAVGPFYCPADRKIYLDTTFFDELSRRFGAPGDFAQAYVIAHEVGHHIQTVTGVSDQVRRAQQSASESESNQLQVRMELQADCYAGVWGAANRQLLEAGDLEEAMRAASAIGDDTLQRDAGRRVQPDSFTHGSAAQRMAWFRRGFEGGDPAQCDTFGATSI